MDPVKTQIKMEVAHCSTLNKQGFIKVNKTLTAISGASNPDELIKILEPDNERRNSSNSNKSNSSNNTNQSKHAENQPNSEVDISEADSSIQPPVR